jgi:hypothetical protein
LQESGSIALESSYPLNQISFSLKICSLSLLFILVIGCAGVKRSVESREPIPSEKTTIAQAFLYDLRIVDGSRIRSGKAELYAIPDTAVLRVKGYLGTLGGIVFAERDRLSVFLPREKQMSSLSNSGDSSDAHCSSIWRLWPLLLRPSLTATELDMLHAWTIVNKSERRQQLLWQHPLCSLTVMVKAKEMNGLWHFEEITASQVDGYIRLSLREHRDRATVPTSRFLIPDTSGWGTIAADELSLSLDD